MAACKCLAALSKRSFDSLKPISSALDFINDCDLMQLRRLEGVGMVTADRLFEARQAVGGRFQAVHQVLSIPRVGKRLITSQVDHKCFEEYEMLADRANVVQKYLNSAQTCTSSVVSIDLGPKNTAWAHVSCNMEVLDMKREELVYPSPYSPQKVTILIKEFLSTLPDVQVYVLEAQSHRAAFVKGMPAGFLQISLQLRIMEVLMYSLLEQLGKTIVLLQPKLTSDLFALQSKGYSRKKKVGVVRVDELLGNSSLDTYCPSLSGEYLRLPKHIHEAFLMEVKKDDLCDSILQALTFYECYKSLLILQNSGI